MLCCLLFCCLACCAASLTIPLPPNNHHNTGAKAGDSLFLHYSGHGGTARDTGPSLPACLCACATSPVVIGTSPYGFSTPPHRPHAHSHPRTPPQNLTSNQTATRWTALTRPSSPPISTRAARFWMTRSTPCWWPRCPRACASRRSSTHVTLVPCSTYVLLYVCMWRSCACFIACGVSS